VRNLLHWIRRLAVWVLEPRSAWVWLVVTLGALALAIAIPKPLEDQLRYAGLALQLLGIATVLRGLRDRGQLFQQPSLFAQFRQWLNRRPKLNAPPTQLAVGIAEELNVSTSMDAVVWRGVRPEDDYEARLAALHQNVETLREELSKQSNKAHAEALALHREVDEERSTRSRDTADIRNTLRTLGAGGLHIELVGVAWLVTGVVLATVPAEISQVVSLVR
jgi:hypothetical protein